MTTEKEKNSRGRKNTLVGIVTSSSAQKTISVEVYRLAKHSKYGKTLRQHRTFKAHDEKSQARVGDKVRIYETRPLSKTKRWMLDTIISASAFGADEGSVTGEVSV